MTSPNRRQPKLQQSHPGHRLPRPHRQHRPIPLLDDGHVHQGQSRPPATQRPHTTRHRKADHDHRQPSPGTGLSTMSRDRTPGRASACRIALYRIKAPRERGAGAGSRPSGEAAAARAPPGGAGRPRRAGRRRARAEPGAALDQVEQYRPGQDASGGGAPAPGWPSHPQRASSRVGGWEPVHPARHRPRHSRADRHRNRQPHDAPHRHPPWRPRRQPAPQRVGRRRTGWTGERRNGDRPVKSSSCLATSRARAQG